MGKVLKCKSKVFIEFGERGAGNRQEVVLPTAILAQELATKLAIVFGRPTECIGEFDFLVDSTKPREGWIGDTHYVSVGIVEASVTR